ncbi:MAG: Gfo/Idh/MocA family oxidoreductase [Pirellulaceae bacterium]|nr:Gfo/Idh/MocA family oxidoreductase [Pirellulaceae bacterium]
MKSDCSVRRAGTRRDFLKRSTALAGAATLPAVLPARVLGRDGSAAPSQRIVLGAIGIGPRGNHVLNCFLPQPDVQFAAICDVRADRRESVKALADQKYGNKDCAMYRDFFELLARPDIDAVLIATGDRWHAPASILAAKAGKDVYSEKPCGITIGLCQALDDTIRRYGRVFQAGTQRRSISNFQAAIHLARSGKLGKLKTLHASIYHLRCDYNWLPAEPEPAKDVIDWDRWLGPAPWRPYNQAYVNGAWRGYYDFDSGATLLDWGAHTVDLCQAANQADQTMPVEYEAEPGSVSTVTARYANGVKLVMRPGGWLGLGTCPVRFEGEEGWVETGDSGKIEVHPASLRGELPAQTAAGGISAAQNVRNFLDCMKSGALPYSHSGAMRHSHIACHAAALSWQLGRKLNFDPASEAFVGDEEANNLRFRAMRERWHV